MEVRAQIGQKTETAVHEETQTFQIGKTFQDQIQTTLDDRKKPEAV